MSQRSTDYIMNKKWQRQKPEIPMSWQCCQCTGVYLYALYVTCIDCEHKRDSCCQPMWTGKDRPSSTTDSKDTSAQGSSLTSTALKEDLQYAEKPWTHGYVLSLSTQSPFKTSGRLLDLPILIEQHEHLAVPDTGTSINAISYAALSRLNSREVIALEDDSAKPESYRLGDGRTIDAIGQIRLHCAFPKASGAGEIPNVLFRVYDNLAMGVSVIIGKPLLDATETLTKYTGRLKQRHLSLGHLPRVMRLRPCKTYMRIYMNSLLAYAYADTGSEVDLISLNYAAQRVFQIHDICEEESRVAFADGRICGLYGKVRIKFELPPPPKTYQSKLGSVGRDEDGLPGKTRELRISSGAPKLPEPFRNFYVFDGLDCDVLLGQILLDAIDAFKSHWEAFVQMETEEHEERMCGIFKVGKLHRFLKRDSLGNNVINSAPATENELYDLIDKVDQCEIVRRNKADADILHCKANYVRETDSKRKAELVAEEHQLIVANRDLCAQYEKEKADLISAFEKANTGPTSPAVSTTLTPGAETDYSPPPAPRNKRFKLFF